MEARFLFPHKPVLHFSPAASICQCGTTLNVFKTTSKTLSTLTIGRFEAVETQSVCRQCDLIYRSEELRKLTPHRGQFGFDVIEYIGQSLFVDCHNESTIKANLAVKNISISTSEIAFLGKRFILYLALAHKQSSEALKSYMSSKGGYILHLDGTCEGGSPHLFSCIDGLSDIVLGNRKMPSEDSQHIIPLLNTFKSDYGAPIALVHDMGKAILKAVETVFPTVPDYICHFHFLRDIGKDLFEGEYQIIRRHISAFKIKPALRKSAKALKIQIDEEPKLSIELDGYLKSDAASMAQGRLTPVITAYLLVTWVLGASSASNGFGFPFDQPHLVFYQRLQEACPVLEQLKEKGVLSLPLVIFNKVLSDDILKNTQINIEQKIAIFNGLRVAMRITCPDSDRGLNDEGEDDMADIEQRVTVFRHSEQLKTLSENNIGYYKMIKQIDKYWEKLFAKPIQVDTPAGQIMLQPQRTNNMMEQTFRFLKRDRRKKSGQHSLSKALVGMLADTPLVRNLKNADYMKILLKGADSLGKRFADIDAKEVLKEEQNNKANSDKYSRNMRRMFKLTDLPKRLMKAA
jgi:hypothetical protein